MKELKIEQIKWQDPSFLKENEDLLSNFLWFCDRLKNGIIKEDRITFPNAWFLFDNEGRFVLQYQENIKCIAIDFKKIGNIFSPKLGNNERLNSLLIPILEQRFKFKENSQIIIKIQGHILLLNRHFRSR